MSATAVDTTYNGRPVHRGYEVEVLDWNDHHVMLVIRSEMKTSEALITPAELLKLAVAAKLLAPGV
jgi:hypothetical protein